MVPLLQKKIQRKPQNLLQIYGPLGGATTLTSRPRLKNRKALPIRPVWRSRVSSTEWITFHGVGTLPNWGGGASRPVKTGSGRCIGTCIKTPSRDKELNFCGHILVRYGLCREWSQRKAFTSSQPSGSPMTNATTICTIEHSDFGSCCATARGNDDSGKWKTFELHHWGGKWSRISMGELERRSKIRLEATCLFLMYKGSQLVCFVLSIYTFLSICRKSNRWMRVVSCYYVDFTV